MKSARYLLASILFIAGLLLLAVALAIDVNHESS